MKHPLAPLLSLLLVSFVCAGCQGQVLDVAHEDAGPTGGDAVRACEDDSDCPERALCRYGICEDVGAGCVSKAECGGELVCVAGTCAPPPESCASSEECPGALLCDGFSRQCFDPNASGCRSDGECALEPGCEDGCACASNGTCTPNAASEPGPGEPPVEDPVSPGPSGDAIDLGGFVLENRENDPPSQVGVLPAGTTLSPGQHLVVGRDADRAAFEAHWGVTLGDDVVYLNAQAGSSGVPIVNGGERWALVSPVGTTVDGVTIAGGKDNAYRRVSAGGASDAASWSEADAAGAAPGQTSLPSSGVGLVVAQWSDAPGPGNYVYEFVELYYAP